MKGLIPGNKVEEVKDKADIVDLISEYVTLKKAGRNFIGLCPFHQEKTPSFTVNRDKQIFYCFGCGEGGNVLTFLMKISHQSFPEAVRYLARKTGIDIPEGVMTREEKERTGIKEQIIRINQIAAKHFSQNLLSRAGGEAREYLLKRGIGESVIKEFKLGYAMDGWRNLRDYFEKEKIPLKLAAQAGLIVQKTNGQDSFYDRFRARVIFPIEDVGGHIVAFGGRVMGKGEPKYLNSPESPVYVKGRCLYGLNRTKDDIRKKGYVIIVEGYFDFLSLWNTGVTNVVASLGTALTKDHVDMIRRYTEQSVAIFDPDEAGKKALARSLALFLAGNIHAKVVVLPDGHDPDQYIRIFGKESFDEVVTNAQSMVDYYIETVIGKTGALEEKLTSLRNAVPFIANIDDAMERNLFINRVSEKLGIDRELLKDAVQRSLTAPAQTSTGVLGSHDKETVDRVELSLIYIMLAYSYKIPEIIHTNILAYLTNSGLRAFGEVIRKSFDRDGAEGIDASFLVDRLDNGIIREKLLKMMVDEPPYDDKMANHILSDTIRKIKIKWYGEKQRILKMELAKAEKMGNRELEKSIIEEKERLRNEEKTLSS